MQIESGAPFGLTANAFALPRLGRFLKRAFDVAVAALCLPALVPIFALIAVSIRRDSPGPVFYTQVRKGKGGRSFRIYKFRTMVVDADKHLEDVLRLNLHADKRLYKIPDDPRVTPIGAFLRRYSLDELPQLINVLKGDMSLVGPRPLTESEDENVKGWACLRANVSPGITGLWQVSGRNELPFEEMMRLDCMYVSNWSFFLDLSLLLQTFPAVVQSQRDC